MRGLQSFHVFHGLRKIAVASGHILLGAKTKSRGTGHRARLRFVADLV
jgi:hypothetical protein